MQLRSARFSLPGWRPHKKVFEETNPTGSSPRQPKNPRIMDIRTRSISFASRPRRPYGPPDHERAGETFSPSLLSNSQTSVGKPTIAFGITLSRDQIPLVVFSVFYWAITFVTRASWLRSCASTVQAIRVS
jgi:hypothetical protein